MADDWLKDVPLSGWSRPTHMAEDFAVVLHADRLAEALAEYVAVFLAPAVERIQAAGYTKAPAVIAAINAAVTSGTTGVLRELAVALDLLLEEEPEGPEAGQ